MSLILESSVKMPKKPGSKNYFTQDTEDAKKQKDWFQKWTFTEEQHNQFKDYAIPLIQKTLKCSKPHAIKSFQWFDLGYGLRLNHEDIQNHQPSE